MLTRAMLLVCTLVLASPLGAATLYLVRHAEKQAGDDPGLTDAGLQRAANLAILLQDADINHLFSSDYRRTRETAAPLATSLGLDIQIYDPRDLASFAEKLRSLDGNALVIGHSNTTPELAQFLGGRSEPMPEWEYDRLYQLQISDVSTTTTVLHLPPESINPE